MNKKNSGSVSLVYSLLIWFLLIALLPMTLTAWLGYRQAVDGLRSTVTQQLQQDAQANARFIQNWFDYRFMDINSQADNQQNQALLIALQQALHEQKTNVARFIESEAWSNIIKSHGNDLSNFFNTYDYVRDVALIDNQGNVLYSIKDQKLLGANLFHEPYAKSNFAKTVRKTLDNNQSLFSDLEHNPVGDHSIISFLVAPIANPQGDIIGAYAIHIKLESIDALMTSQNDNNSLQHYLIGEEGLLRTSPNKNYLDKILRQRIDSTQFQGRESAQANTGIHHPINSEAAFEYEGISGDNVIGLHQAIKLPGANWILISEADKDKALSVGDSLQEITLTVFLISTLLASLLAIYQTRRITLPIIKLVNASKAVAEGKLDQQVTIKANNEIGTLAEAFNKMLLARKKHDSDLEKSTAETKKALASLAAQKFALDQHSIVAITDAQGTITFVNDKFTEISGYSPDELLGENHRLLNSGHHDKNFFSTMFQAIASGKVWHGEICNKSKSGSLYWVETTIVPFIGDNGKPDSYIAIRTDITARKKVELDLLEAKEAAETATRQKSDFLANMSHEIRTPMNGIIGMTGLLLDSPLNTKQRSYAKATMSSADALLTIINDILDFSKIEAGKLELEEVPFDLQALMEDVSDLMALKCHEKQVEMLMLYKPGTERFVIGDPGRIRQILLNLLSNAIKFTEHGHILLTVTSNPLANNSAAFSVTVEDTGIGIAKEKLQFIFNKFDQEDSSTTRKYGGTGLGLAICKQLCNLMSGDIDVQSEKGKGSTFAFNIALTVDKDALSQHPEFNNNPFKGSNTLIVDKSAVAGATLREQLSQLEMNITVVSTGKEAIEKLTLALETSNPYQIVITDQHIPEMGCEGLAFKIKEADLLSNGIFLLMVSSIKTNDPVRLKNTGFDGCLAKPIHADELMQILTVIWSAKKQNQEIALVTRHSLLETKTGTRTKPAFSNTQILLAEDNPINVMVASELLEGYGCTITPAGNGLEALALVKDRNFDLIFMDCQMPEMDGFEATAAIRKFQQEFQIEHTPIVAFTANAMKADQEKCIRAGMDDYISKPVNQLSLENILTAWLPHKLNIADNSDVSNAVSTEAIDDTIKLNSDSALDVEVFHTLKRLFNDKFPFVVAQHTQNALENVLRAKTAIEENNADALERAAHSLKGACAQFGAIRLTNIAIELEDLARYNRMEQTKTLIEELQEAQQEVAKLMAQEVSAS